MVDEILDIYAEFDARAAEFGSSETLRKAGQWLASQLPTDERVKLLARTDAALMTCAAAAVLRDAGTEIQRAPFGRTGWKPPSDGVLVEHAAITEGMHATVVGRWKGLKVLSVPSASFLNSELLPPNCCGEIRVRASALKSRSHA